MALARSPPKSQKNGNGEVVPHSLTHEHHGRHRGEQGDRESGRYRRDGFALTSSAIAERAVADLIMVLQKVDECER